MGSLFSSPAALPSAQSQVITSAVTPVTSVSATNADITGASSDVAVTQISADQSQSEQRTENLLKRDRGVFGTLQTSARGLLSDVNEAASAPRKTLLGE